MRVTVIPFVVGTLGTVLKGLERRLEEFEIKGIETIQTTTWLRSTRIGRRDLERLPVKNYQLMPM